MNTTIEIDKPEAKKNVKMSKFRKDLLSTLDYLAKINRGDFFYCNELEWIKKNVKTKSDLMKEYRRVNEFYETLGIFIVHEYTDAEREAVGIIDDATFHYAIGGVTAARKECLDAILEALNNDED